MKKLIYLSLFVVFMTGCRKDHGYQDSGTIIGQDYRKCMCCGGWFIEIDKDTLRFQQVPDGFTINLNDAKYPVEVYLDWQHKDPKCLGDEIIVIRMELKK